MKKSIALFLSLVFALSLCFSLTACDSDRQDTTNGTPNDSTGHTHLFGDWEEVTAATCTEDGLRRRTCSSCGKTEEETIKAPGHSMKDGVCENCGYNETTHTHSFGDWEEVTAATCTEDGLRRRTCSSCNKTEEETIKSPGHSIKDGVCEICGYTEIWQGLTAESFTGYMTDFEGEIGGETFKGVRMNVNDYQPKTYITEAAMTELRAYARANGYDGLRVHVYVQQYNNMCMVGDKYAAQKVWTVIEIGLGDLKTTTPFWSQSEGGTDNYFWFELINMPVINASSLGGEGVSAFEGTIADETFKGLYIKSWAYQPAWHFTESAVQDIKDYAAENGYDALNIRFYALLGNNMMKINGHFYADPGVWSTYCIKTDDLTTSFEIRSESESSTEIYVQFEFVKLPNEQQIIYSSSFTGVSFENFSGNVGGVDMIGVKGYAKNYQPAFAFRDGAIEAIKAYAEANGYDTLRIHAYAILTNNDLVLDDKIYVGAEWKSLDVAIANLSTDFGFKSYSEGTSEIYLWFEFDKTGVTPDPDPSVNDIFVGDEITVSPFTGEVGGETISGYKVTSGAYQPQFKFTEAAVAEIKAYAAQNGYDTLTIHAYAILTNNQFVLNDKVWIDTDWKHLNVAIDTLDTSFKFQSTSEGTSEIYLWYEFCARPAIDADTFTGVATSDITTTIDGVRFTGLKVQAYTGYAHYRFTEEGIARIRAYAEANGYDTLTIHYCDTTASGMNMNGTWGGYGKWSEIAYEVSELSTDMDFWSACDWQICTYMWFEFSKAPVEVIDASSFSGSYNFSDFEGEICGKKINGIKATSSDYQPHFYFTADAIAKIKAYADDNNYSTLILYYCDPQSIGLNMNGAWGGYASWSYTALTISELSTSTDFWSASEGTTECYLSFAFGDAPQINRNFLSGLDFSDFGGSVGGKDILGVKGTSWSYQPCFYFTADGVESIKAYATENGYNTLTIHAYAILANNMLVLNDQAWVAAEWVNLDVAIDSLDTNFKFQSQSEGRTECYLYFEFK